MMQLRDVDLEELARDQIAQLIAARRPGMGFERATQELSRISDHAATWPYGRACKAESISQGWPDVGASYKRLYVTAETKGWLWLAFLKSKGKAIAYEYNPLYGKKLFNLKLRYRQGVARFSPGLILKSDVIEDAIRQGAREYDLLGTDEPNKLHWANDPRQHCEVVIFNRRRQVGLWFYRYCIKAYLRRYLPGLLSIKRWPTTMSATENPSSP